MERRTDRDSQTGASKEPMNASDEDVRQSSGSPEHAELDERSGPADASYSASDPTLPAGDSVAPAASASRRGRLRSWLTNPPRYAIPGIGVVLTLVLVGAIILRAATAISLAPSTPQSFAAATAT